jgi:sugar lactone lactonase YvrE
VLAHPASGIVVDAKGQVFFVQSGKGLMKIEPDGRLTCIHPSRGGHWLCLDPAGSFSRTQPKYFERVTPDAEKPAIIFADGGAPIAVCRDGNLYYGSNANDTNESPPGGLTVTRMSPDGKLTQFAPDLATLLASFEDGVTGLAAAPDGSLYVASWSSVLKVGMDGAIITICHPVKVADCDEDPPDHHTSNHKPALRGLAVDSNGSVYTAATSCHRVLRITPDGRVGIILKSERPWAPTAVALHDGAVYVLEYTNANGGSNEDGGWRPRVRGLDPDGKVTTLAEVSKQDIERR